MKVLIVRIGAMGDVLHAMPAVTALRELHPEWEIGWAIEPGWERAVAGWGEPAFGGPVVSGGYSGVEAAACVCGDGVECAAVAAGVAWRAV